MDFENILLSTNDNMLLEKSDCFKSRQNFMLVPISDKTDSINSKDRIDSKELSPNVSGKYFKMVKNLSIIQQRERIAICPPSDYPEIKIKSDINVPSGQLILIIYICHSFVAKSDHEDVKSLEPEISCMNVWPTTSEGKLCNCLEVRPKTPNLLSNKLDNEKIKTGFFYLFKFYVHDRSKEQFKLLDEFSSNVFRTVSHSNLAINKRIDIQSKGSGIKRTSNFKNKSGKKSKQ